MSLFEVLFSAGATTAAGIQLLTWIREKYGEKASETLEKKLQKFNWSTASGRYRDEIEKNFGQIKLLGTDIPIGLDEIFTDVYLLRESDAFDYYKTVDLTHEIPGEKRFEGIDFVKEAGNFLYILGKPGAGKTTFLKYIAVKAARGEIEKIPIFISLKDWANSNKEMLDYLVKQFDICNFPDAKHLIEYILGTGQAIVLLDGLDEVPESNETRRNIIVQIKEFTTKYKESQFLITCRIAASDYSFQYFTYLRVADFTPEQIERYVNKWFKGRSPEKREKFKQELFHSKNEPFLEMASQPLLLSLLCISFNETMTFSESRTDIFDEAIGVLLEKWNAFNDVKREEIFPLTKGRKMQMFSQIAFDNLSKKNFQNGENYDRFRRSNLAGQISDFLSRLPDAPAKEDIDGEQITKNIEANTGILIERYRNIYSFGHLSLQEFFAARYVSEKDARIKRLLTRENLTDARWHEVILNTVALLSDADLFFEIFYDMIDQIISAEPDLVGLLRAVGEKAESVQSTEKISVLRFFYLYLMLFAETAYARIRTGDLSQTVDITLADEKIRAANLVHELDFARDLAFALEPGLSRALNCARTVDLANSLADTHVHASARALDRALNAAHKNIGEMKSEIDLVFDYQIIVFYLTLHHFKDTFVYYENRRAIIRDTALFWQDTIKICDELGDPKLLAKVKLIEPPNKQLFGANYNTLVSQVHEIMQMRKIKFDIEVDHEKLRILNKYFEANHFLIECLRLASVSDRTAAEGRMFLAPE